MIPPFHPEGRVHVFTASSANDLTKVRWTD